MSMMGNLFPAQTGLRFFFGWSADCYRCQEETVRGRTPASDLNCHVEIRSPKEIRGRPRVFKEMLQPIGRGGGIRTRDIKLPKLALYQAEPRPDTEKPSARPKADLRSKMAGSTGLEPATPRSTVWYSNQLSYDPVAIELGVILAESGPHASKKRKIFLTKKRLHRGGGKSIRAGVRCACSSIG